MPQAMVNSSDANAQRAVGYVDTANTFAQYMQFLTPPSKMDGLRSACNYQGSPWVYTWAVDSGQSDNYTVNLTIDETDTTYTWKVLISGTIYGVAVNDFRLIDGLQNKNGTGGNLFVYDPNGSNLKIRLIWDRGVDHYLLQYGYIPDGTLINVTLNNDNTGRVSYSRWDESKSRYILNFQAVWYADGSGQWYTYDSDGNLDEQGTWGV